MHRPAYGQVPGLWEVEGSLRDVYILRTDTSDWAGFMNFAARHPCTYFDDGVVKGLPPVDQIFADRDRGHMLRINLGTATIHCHFFVTSEIELDLDPREIQGQKEHDEVFSFIEGLAVAIGKPALLTPENSSNLPYLSFEPDVREWRVHSLSEGGNG